METLLFTKDDLASALHATARKMSERLANWDHDALLTAPEADLVDELIEDGCVQCPQLMRDQAEMLPPIDGTMQFRTFNGVAERCVKQLVLVVPYIGDRAVFTMRANTFSVNPPGVAAIHDDELWIAVNDPAGDALTVRAQFDAQLEKIETHLAWSRKQIEEHNEQIRVEVPRMVAGRRAELLAMRNLQAEIGFPIRHRRDANTYAVPLRRRKLRPVRQAAKTATKPFKPEPTMADSDYQAVLTVLRLSRNSLERNPSLAAKLKEEEIRNLLLVNLNSHFEGDAAGEVFNGDGKTDILVRDEDSNIFIGECKVWGGPGTMDDALGQIFKYLVWRDTKAAILLFIRNKDVTAAIRKAVEKIEEHPNYKRRGPQHSDDQLDFVMHTQDDPEREIHLALLPFALRTPVRG